jgi:transmembrane sensor
MRTSNEDALEIAAQAAEFVLRLEDEEVGVELELSDWLARSPRHLKELRLSIAIHQQIRKMGADLQAKTQGHSTQSDSSKMDRPGGRRMETPGRYALRHPVALFIAAAAALVVGALFGLYLYYQPLLALSENPHSYRLIDGSLVQLNAKSAAHRDFHGGRRNVRLWRGEAFFDVERDVIHPFTVTAGNAIVRAVGTTFDVLLLSPTTTVTVKAGRVELEGRCESSSNRAADSTRTDDRIVTLEAGEQATVSRDGCVRMRAWLDPMELDRQLAWSHERVDFRSETLRSAVDQLNRYNRRQLLIPDPTIQDVLCCSGLFDSKNLDSFIKALQPLGIKPAPQRGARQEALDIALIGPNCHWDGVRCNNE